MEVSEHRKASGRGDDDEEACAEGRNLRMAPRELRPRPTQELDFPELFSSAGGFVLSSKQHKIDFSVAAHQPYDILYQFREMPLMDELPFEPFPCLQDPSC